MAEPLFSLEIRVKNLRTGNDIVKTDLNLPSMQQVFNNVERIATELAIACHDNSDPAYKVTLD